MSPPVPRQGKITQIGATGAEIIRRCLAYWVPLEPNQKSPRGTISLICDDRRLLETRVRRLSSPRIYSQERRSRTSRIIANVMIEESAGAACSVRSKFQLLEYRREA